MWLVVKHVNREWMICCQPLPLKSPGNSFGCQGLRFPVHGTKTIYVLSNLFRLLQKKFHIHTASLVDLLSSNINTLSSDLKAPT